MTVVEVRETARKIRTDDRRRVLHVATLAGEGGTETYLVRLLEHFDRSKFVMDVCAICDGPPAYRARIEGAGSKLLQCPHTHLILPYARRLRRIIRQGGYDTVLDYSADMAAASILAAWSAGVTRRIAFYRSAGVSYRPTLGRRMYAWLMRRIIGSLATSVLSNSEQALRHFYPRAALNCGKFHVLPNGLEVERYVADHEARRRRVRAELGVDDGTIVIGHVGSFRPEKDHGTLLAAVDRLRGRVGHFLVILLGQGRLRDWIESEIARLRLGDVVRLLGFRSDAEDVLQGMDLFLFPSKFEGCPNALIEAQCAGLPFAASDRPEMREVVPPANHDWLAPVGDAEPFARILAVQCADLAAAKRKAEVGRQFAAQRFGMDAHLRQVCAFF